MQTRVNILGFPVDAVTREEALEKIDRFFDDRRPHRVVTLDASMLVDALSHPELAEAVRTADLVIPDGYGIVWASRVLGTPVPGKLAGIDLMADLIRQAAAEDRGVFLLGASAVSLARAEASLRRTFPDLRVVGHHNGYFPPDKEPDIVAGIRKSAPGYLFVGLERTRQEIWVYRNQEKMQVPVSMGVGGSFDVFSGRVAAAPGWVRRGALEWLWRAAQRPGRVLRLWRLPVFVFRVLRGRYVGRRR